MLFHSYQQECPQINKIRTQVRIRTECLAFIPEETHGRSIKGEKERDRNRERKERTGIERREVQG